MVAVYYVMLTVPTGIVQIWTNTLTFKQIMISLEEIKVQ
jgi:hypothetical protein